MTAEAGRLVADSVELTYGAGSGRVHALRRISLNLEPGAFVALIGPSGSGKTSLLHCLGGLQAPTAGEVRWDGRRLSGLELPSRIGARGAAFAYVFQGGNLLPTFTAAENVAFAALVSGRRHEVRPLELLTGVGLDAKAQALPDELSGGEQQRVAMVRALAQGARVLLADEPTGQLDSTTANRVLDLIDSVRADHPDLIVVLATHDVSVADRAQRSIEIVDGRLLQELSRR
ncbi:MAG: ABC transporter ATP-binding protein [Candidatus Dormibacteraeota bacterium]|nr:ABC transporter ATP-binding protein [Candidatus Dormibacteraeota bacterium]